MINIYSSKYAAAQVESAFDVVIGAGVTKTELTFLKGSTMGGVVASKALIADAQKQVTGLSLLSVSKLQTSALQIAKLLADPAAPVSGYVQLYALGSKMYWKDGNNVNVLGGGITKEYGFTNVNSVTFTHGLGYKYPFVRIIGSDAMDIEAQIYYVDVNTVNVAFGSPKTGRLIVNMI